MTIQGATGTGSPPGRMFAGYRLLERVGEGGMGVVWRAVTPGGAQVAIKVLRSHLAADPVLRMRFEREVHTLSRIRGSNVAEVIDADVAGDLPFLVTRFVEGPSLHERVDDTGVLRGPQLRVVAIGLLIALECIHAAGVVHRDLKPGNVLLEDGEPQVIDFGIAQLNQDVRLTMTGMVFGTPGYLAPELLDGADPTPAVDIHAWGATMAFAGTARPPFGRGSLEAVALKVLQADPDLAGLERWLEPAVAAAMAKHPDDRPTAAELTDWFESGRFTLGQKLRGARQVGSVEDLRPPAEATTDFGRPGLAVAPGATDMATALDAQAAGRWAAGAAPGVANAAEAIGPVRDLHPAGTWSPPARWADEQEDGDDRSRHWPEDDWAGDNWTGANEVARSRQAGDGQQHSPDGEVREWSAEYHAEAASSARALLGPILAWLGAAGAACAVNPWLGVAALLGWGTAAAAVYSGHAHLIRRTDRRARAARSVVVLASPWHLVKGLLTALVAVASAVLISVVLVGSAAVLFRLGGFRGLPMEPVLVTAGLGAGVLTWFGLWSERLREGTVLLTRRLTGFPHGRLVMTLAGIVAVAVLVSLATAYEVSFWPVGWDDVAAATQWDRWFGYS